MYIIEEGKAYFVEGEVGYLANFDTTGKMLIDKKDKIDVEGKTRYTYEEMYAKLNIAYMIEQAKKKKMAEETGNELVNELTAEVEKLTKENGELKAIIKELENKKPEEPEKVEEPSNDKLEEPEIEEETEEENTNKKEKK